MEMLLMLGTVLVMIQMLKKNLMTALMIQLMMILTLQNMKLKMKHFQRSLQPIFIPVVLKLKTEVRPLMSI